MPIIRTLPWDVIAIAANEDPLYIPFWPMVAWANRAVFGCEAHLAFLSDRAEDEPYVAELRRHGPVTLFKRIPGVPDGNLAKMVRAMLCSTLGDRVGYIQDIDLLPLNRDWPVSKIARRPSKSLRLCGAEVYGAVSAEARATTSVPASMMTAEGSVWKKFINPDNLPYEALVKSWAARKNPAPNEDITTLQYHERDQCFSDEKFMRTLRLENYVATSHVQRGYDVQRDTLDRSCWNLDLNRLNDGEYIESHLPRPLDNHLPKIQPLIDFISTRFAGGTLPLTPLLDLGYQPDRRVFGGGGISRELFSYITGRWTHCKALELGSGNVSTQYLGEIYDVTSIDESPDWLHRHNATYVHAPIVDGFYDMAKLAHLGQFRFMLVDGPADVELRKNFLLHAHQFKADTIILNGVVGCELAPALGENLGVPVKWGNGFAVVENK